MRESPTTAALPWYNFPSTRTHLDAVWRETRSLLEAKGFSTVPKTLDHAIGYEELFDCPQLTLSQCCGLDLFQAYARNVLPFAVPKLTSLDVADGDYFSYIVARRSASTNFSRMVINNRFSHSGHTALKIWLAENGIIDFNVFESGSHAQSLAALRENRADVAAIDAFSFGFLDSAGIAIVDKSHPAPAPPFIAGKQSAVPVEELTIALNEGFERCGASLGIDGVLAVTADRYTQMNESAAQLGILRSMRGD